LARVVFSRLAAIAIKATRLAYTLWRLILDPPSSTLVILVSFPFDLLDFVLPEIAHWMAGKSNSEKRRFRRAGVGLLLFGVVIAACSLIFPTIATWAFNSLAWAYFTAFMFSGCGAGLLTCIWCEQRNANKASGFEG